MSYSDASRFMQAVFGHDYSRSAVFCNLNPPYHTRDLQTLDDRRDCYWSVAAFSAGAKTNKAEAHMVLDVRALVIDDVGTKIRFNDVTAALGHPTACVMTSAGNYQWIYRLSRPVSVQGWAAFFAGVEAKIGCKLEGKDAVHLFRLPMGVNTKPGRNGFEVKLTVLLAGRELDVTKITPVAMTTGHSSGGDGAADKLGLDALRDLLALVPNNLDREGWIDVGHDIKALCEDDDDGFQVFDEWSQWHATYDAGKTRTAWDSFGSGGLKSKGLGLRARATAIDAGGYAGAMNKQARAVFDDGAAPPPSPVGGERMFSSVHADMAAEIVRRERAVMGWLSNSQGRRWGGFDPVLGRWVVEDHDAIMRAAVREEILAARLATGDDKLARRMGEAKWQGAVQSLLHRHSGLKIPFERFDADLDMFGVPGGVVRLGAAGAVEEAGNAGQMVSRACSVRPAPRGVNGVAWTQFLDQFCMGDPELVAWWQAWCGYCLTGHTNEHLVVFLYGPGGNGKSVFLDTIGEVLGPYHERSAPQVFMTTKGGKHMAMVADLAGARLVTSPDVPLGAEWDLGMLKPLTGGGTFKAQFMKENWFAFTPQFKLILAGNEKPVLGTVDAAVRRRFVLVPAMNVPRVVNKNLVDVLRGEKAAILRWMIDGWEKYQAGGLPRCAAIERATAEYIAEQDTFSKWVGGTLAKTPGDKTRHRIQDLWRSWDAFRASDGAWRASPVNVQGLSTKLREAGFDVDRDKNGGYVTQVTVTAAQIF